MGAMCPVWPRMSAGPPCALNHSIIPVLALAGARDSMLGRILIIAGSRQLPNANEHNASIVQVWLPLTNICSPSAPLFRGMHADIWTTASLLFANPFGPFMVQKVLYEQSGLGTYRLHTTGVPFMVRSAAS